MRNSRLIVAASFAVLAVTASGCSGSTPGGNSTSGNGRGPITFATGKDTTGKLQGLLDQWNKAHPSEKVTLVELSENADDQRNAMVQNFQAKSSRFDVVNSDVVWTAEFAARHWIQSLDGSIDTSGLLPATVATATYNGKLYAAPFTSDGGLLYYRKDLVARAPRTWAALKIDCAIAKQHKMGCYAGQFAQYEGLTVNVSEAIDSAGGSILKNSGKKVTVDSPQAKVGLDFLVNGFKQGYIPSEAITYQEEDARRAFQQGHLLFMRNWPYVYNLAQAQGKDSVVQNKFAVAPLPGPNGPGSSTLGGHNLALSSYSKHPKSAIDWMKFMESANIQRKLLTQLSNAPVVASLYDDPKLQQQVPYLATLKQSILSAKTRPVTPVYNEVTLAIEKNSYAALQGKKSVDQALKDMAADIKRAAADN
ncbi:MAG TPA: ABC transporter substrate-binding protein [Mycobacteriales bacterium]|nr:ABC transporter substrate-binding protein [Mycobacteriales bacterium]